mgnify:CR=1 FL=1
MPKDHAYLYLGSISEARRNNELDDMTLYAMGLLPEADIEKLMSAAIVALFLTIPNLRGGHFKKHKKAEVTK